jgi:hypothetical protein
LDALHDDPIESLPGLVEVSPVDEVPRIRQERLGRTPEVATQPRDAIAPKGRFQSGQLIR